MQVLRGYLGGAGLGTWLLHHLAPPGVEPLAPHAPLAFVFSPLVGTPLTTSAKFAVVAKSPLTGFAHGRARLEPVRDRGKATGHDAIVVTGRAPSPSVLLVDADGRRPGQGQRRDSDPLVRRVRPAVRADAGGRYIAIPEEATGLDTGTEVTATLYA